MRKFLLAAAVLLAPCGAPTASGQNAPAPPAAPTTAPPVPSQPVADAPQPAQELLLAQQPIGKWSGPLMWVSKDLLLLGRADRDADNTKLWFWSPAGGAFPVSLPANLEPQNRPNGSSICAGDGEVKWLGAVKPQQSGMPTVVPERQIFRLIVDPVTKESRLDSSQREQIIGTQYDTVFVNKNAVALSGFYFMRMPTCRLVSAVAMVEGLKRLPQLTDVPNVTVAPVANGDYVVSWDPRTIGADGIRVSGLSYLLVSSVFKPREPQPEQPRSLINPLTPTPYGALAQVDIAKMSDPPQFQLQLTLPSGAKRAIATSQPGFGYGLNVSPDGCLVRFNIAPRSRMQTIEQILQVVRPAEVRPAPPRPVEVRPLPPAPPMVVRPPAAPAAATLGPATNGIEYSMIDVCSPESRKLLDAVK